MKKKLSAIIATVMILSMGVTAFADIQPRTPTCINCGSGNTYDVSEDDDYPLAPQVCDKCGVKTSQGILKIRGYACRDCGESMIRSEFICFDCQ